MHPEPQSQSMNHRTRGRWITAGATAMALLAASCAGTSGSSASGGAATTSSAQAPVVTTQAPKPLQQPGARCGAPRTKATLVRFTAADGTSLDGVMVGSGTTGVVLAHEYLADLCGAWPFADYLAKRGLRAFAVDLRCFGLSSCPQGDAKGRVVDDVVAAVAEFRRRGATKVALVGASMGGSAVLIAGTRVEPPVDAVVELSGQADPTSQLGGIPLNAGAAVAQLAVPTMFMVANNDAYTTVEETRAMHQAAKAGDKRLEVLSGEFDGRHGWGLLTDVGKGGSPRPPPRSPSSSPPTPADDLAPPRWATAATPTWSWNEPLRAGRPERTEAPATVGRARAASRRLAGGTNGMRVCGRAERPPVGPHRLVNRAHDTPSRHPIPILIRP
jgi:alpha-beta hydrolase superfamily lysophospholipase